MTTSAPRDVVMWIAWVLSGVSALVTAGLIVLMATSFAWPILVGAVFMAFITAMFGLYADDLMGKVEGKTSIFSNTAEKELLTTKQRRKLKAARGEVLMELAMLDVEHEKENILHRQTEDAGSMATPPHKTSFTNPDGSPRQIGGKY